jgi:beta-xylosidase
MGMAMKGRAIMGRTLAAVIVVIGMLGSVQATAENYLFSYFTGNGEDGLHLAHSTDGLKWTTLKGGKPFLAPTVGGKLMRDPCICQGPDGTFHMVWTSGWWDKGIGIAHSKDLIAWSEPQWLPVMTHEPNAVNCWAPEIFYDGTTQQHLIFWATTIPGRFPDTEQSGGDRAQGVTLNHRMYYTTTADFKTYADTRLFYNDGFNVIDATLVADGDKYVMFVKDETRAPVAKKHIRIATAGKAEGPYGHASEPFTPDWVEGPTALKIGDTWYVYYDGYTRRRMEGSKSKDLKTWESITDQLSFPNGVRHGTAFKVPDEIMKGLKALQ